MQEHEKKYGVCYSIEGQLNSFIDCVFVENYFSRPQNQGVVSRIVPDNTVELIITDKLFHRRYSENGKLSTLKSHFSGLKTKWQEISLEGSPLISIRFKLDKIFQLTQLPSREFINKSLSPKDVFGAQFDGFESQLFELKSINSKIKLIQTFFETQLSHSPELKDSVFQVAKATIERKYGNVQLRDLCVELKISQKTLENKFNLFLGITPKEYCRLIRFVNSVKRYNSSEMNLTNLAYSSDFFDQSHLIKEYKNYTGLSPKDFFSSSFGIQEDIF